MQLKLFSDSDRMGLCKLHVYALLLLDVLAMVHPLQAVDFFDDENEEAISRRCNPAIPSCFPTQLQWAELDSNLTGRLVWRDKDPDYSTSNFQYNLAFTKYPMVHVLCKTVSDIQNAIRFARQHNLRVTIKSTGTDLWGMSSAHDSLNINLREMKEISVNADATERSENGEVTIQTGANFGEIYEELEKYDRVVVAGNNLMGGFGGFVAGGGYATFTPGLGLSVDNILEIKVVLADGRVATCTQNKTVVENNGQTVYHNNGDLFWALRGGGGGTYGIVVHYVMKLHRAPSSIVKAFINVPIHHNGSDVPNVKRFLEAYSDWLSNAPSYWGGHSNIASFRVGAKLTKYGTFDGNTRSELQQFYNLDDLIDIELVNYTTFRSSLTTDHPYMRGFCAGASFPLEKHNDSLWNFITQETLVDKQGFCILTRLRGKTLGYDETPSAVPVSFRRAQSTILCSYFAPTNGDEIATFQEQARQQVLVSNFADNVRMYGEGANIGAGYVPSLDWKDDFWGENYEDLLKIKIKYDPDNLFYCYHCVGSDMKPRYEFESSGARAYSTWSFPMLLSLAFAISMCDL